MLLSACLDCYVHFCRAVRPYYRAERHTRLCPDLRGPTPTRPCSVGEQGQSGAPHLQLRPHKQPRPRRPDLLRLAHPPVRRREKLHGYHPTQKPLRLLRRSIMASTREGELVFDPFCGSGTTGVAAKEPPGASSWGRRGSGSTPSLRDAGSGLRRGARARGVKRHRPRADAALTRPYRILRGWCCEEGVS